MVTKMSGATRHCSISASDAILISAVSQHSVSAAKDLERTTAQGPSYSQRNTFADIAVQMTNVSVSAATSVPCASHDSPFQIPSSNDTA